MPISPAEQDELRARFRGHWQDTVPFNVFSGLRIERWDPDGVTCVVPLRPELTAHKDIFHGGVIASLVDTCAGAAVMAGHDFGLGSRLSTISMSVQYLAVSPGEAARAEGRCLRRGREIHFAEVRVVGADSGKLLATGQVTVSVTGRHRILETG